MRCSYHPLYLPHTSIYYLYIRINRCVYLHVAICTLPQLTHDFSIAMQTAKTTTRPPSPDSTFGHHGFVRNPAKSRSNGTTTLGRSAAVLAHQARRGAVNWSRSRTSAVRVLILVINGVFELCLCLGDFYRFIIAISVVQRHIGFANLNYMYLLSIAHLY